MKRFLSMFLCLGLVLGITGCGSSTGGEKESESSVKTNSEERQDLKIEETGWYLSDDTYPYVNYSMKITNPNKNYYVALPQISVTSYDADDNILGSTETYLRPLEPGQTINFAFQADCNQTAPDHVEFKVINTKKDYRKEKTTTKTIELEASNVNVVFDGYWYKITGMAKNTSEQDTKGNPAVCIIFYKEGKMVGGTGTYLEDMGAGTELAFDAMASQLPDYDEIKTFIYAEVDA